MSSFAIVQKNTTTNTPYNTMGSAVASGNALGALWAAGTSGGGNPTLPTTITDDNGNVYDQTSFTYSASPPQAITALYVCAFPTLTPHNPPTLQTSGAGGVPSGGPSIIFFEFSHPPVWSISGAVCNRNSTPGTNIVLSNIGQLNGVGVGANLNLTASDNDEAYANSVMILEAPYSDAMVLFCDYDYNTAATWTTSGTIIDYTAEAQVGTGGRTAVLAYQNLTYSSMVCGYSGPIASCNGIQNGKLGVPYTWTLGVTGGTYPYTWAITAGSLPPGLTLSSAGVISGTPTTAGAWWFTATVTDSDGLTASTTCAIGICAPSGGNVFY